LLEGTAVHYIGRQIGVRWVLMGLLIVAGFLGLRWTAISEAQTQTQDRAQQIEELRRAEAEARAKAEAAKQQAEQLLAKSLLEQNKAPVPVQKHFLEKGKSYYFVWVNQLGGQTCVVLEEPKDSWVKVRDGNNQEAWINLGLVGKISPAPEAPLSRRAP
jgi:hypothetical protein